MNGYCSQVSLWWALMIRFAKTSFSLINTVRMFMPWLLQIPQKTPLYCISLFFLNGLLFFLPNIAWRFQILAFPALILLKYTWTVFSSCRGWWNWRSVTLASVSWVSQTRPCQKAMLFSICLVLILGFIDYKGPFLHSHMLFGVFSGVICRLL